MDVILLNASDMSRENVEFDSIMNSSVEMLPLGLCYIASELKNSGYSVKIVDMCTVKKEKHDEVLKEILHTYPKCIGISSTTPSYNNAKQIAKFFKYHLGRKFPIIMGGYHVTFEPNEVLSEKIVDVVIRGEGESVITEVVDSLINRNYGGLKVIGGISYFDGENVIHNTPSILRVENLDNLELPNRKLLDLSKYRNIGTVISSRGCTGRCQFCAAGAFGKIRCRSIKSVVEEIMVMYKEYSCKHIFFVDNTFASDKLRTIKLLEEVNKNTNELKFSIEARVSEVDRTYIQKLVNLGVVALQFGVESGNNNILKKIHKDINLGEVEKGVDYCLEFGLSVMCSFVIGHPADTKETIMDTINFAKMLRKKGAQVSFGIMTPYPGTEAFNRRKALGIEIIDWNYEHWDLNRAVINTKYVTQKELNALYLQAQSTIYAI